MGKIILVVIPLIANLFTIFASGIVIYLFFSKREVVSSVFKALLNYSFQLTLSELRTKLDRLNDFNANEDNEEVINIFNEIVGQIRGNRKLKKQCAEILGKMEKYAVNSKKLIEPIKRSLVSELRESIRHIDIETFDELIGGKNE